MNVEYRLSRCLQIPAHLRKQNFQVRRLPLGFGWEILEKNGHHVLDHGGAWQGFKTHISRYVDDKLTVVVLTNLDSADPGRIADHVAKLYLAP